MGIAEFLLCSPTLEIGNFFLCIDFDIEGRGPKDLEYSNWPIFGISKFLSNLPVVLLGHKVDNFIT